MLYYQQQPNTRPPAVLATRTGSLTSHTKGSREVATSDSNSRRTPSQSHNDLQSHIRALFSAFGGQSATLTIPRPYLDLCNNDHLAALLLSQLVYWTGRTQDPDGWVAKSYADWQTELGMTQYQISRVVKVLAAVGVETHVHRSKFYDGAPVVHYRIDKRVFETAIMTYLKKLDNRVSSLSESEETQQTITESTAEHTAERAPAVSSTVEGTPVVATVIPPQTEIPDHVAPADRRRVVEFNDTAGLMEAYQLEAAYRKAFTDTGLTPRALSVPDKKVAVALAQQRFTFDDVYTLVKAKLDTNRRYRFAFLGQDLPDARNAAARVAPPPPVVVAPAAPAVIDIRSAEERARLIRDAKAALDGKAAI